MTWIVGTTTPFGHAYLVSDICVTLENGQTLDCLQKIYPLGRFVVGGFAGSVKMGFTLLEVLRRELSKADHDDAVIVDVIANTWWPRLARRHFNKFPEKEKALRSSIILASAHPTKNRGDAPWAVTDVHLFRSPEFKVENVLLETRLLLGAEMPTTT